MNRRSCNEGNKQKTEKHSECNSLRFRRNWSKIESMAKVREVYKEKMKNATVIDAIDDKPAKKGGGGGRRRRDDGEIRSSDDSGAEGPSGSKEGEHKKERKRKPERKSRTARRKERKM